VNVTFPFGARVEVTRMIAYDRFPAATNALMAAKAVFDATSSAENFVVGEII